MWSWKNGLKTAIYYLRSKPAQDATQFTIDPNIQQKLNTEQTISSPNKEKRFKKPEEGQACDSCSG
jgi:hypothetical protein